jgi:endonuclease G
MGIGYLHTFLEGSIINFPSIDANYPISRNTIILPYTHFSVFYSKDRKQPISTAVNIDGKNFMEIKRKENSDTWLFDNKVDVSEQIGKDFYSQTQGDFQKGHIVRRLDPCWGDPAVTLQGERDTFHYCNASPQHRKFNPAIWLELERNILEKGAVAYDEKITVLAGPVLSPADKPFIKKINNELIFIPSRFWKIIFWRKLDSKIFAVGFMQSQENLIYRWVDQNYGKARTRGPMDDHFENMQFKNNAVYQVNITDIEKTTGLKFDLKNIQLPKVSTNAGISELIRGSQNVRRSQKRYRNTDEKTTSIEGMILE